MDILVCSWERLRYVSSLYPCLGKGKLYYLIFRENLLFPNRVGFVDLVMYIEQQISSKVFLHLLLYLLLWHGCSHCAFGQFTTWVYHVCFCFCCCLLVFLLMAMRCYRRTKATFFLLTVKLVRLFLTLLIDNLIWVKGCCPGMLISPWL